MICNFMSFFLVLREVPEVPTGLNENVWKTGRIGYWKKLTIGSASNSVSRPDSIVNLVQRILSGKKTDACYRNGVWAAFRESWFAYLFHGVCRGG